MKIRMAGVAAMVLAVVAVFYFQKTTVAPLPAVAPVVTVPQAAGSIPANEAAKKITGAGQAPLPNSSAPPSVTPGDLSARAGKRIRETALETNLPPDTVMRNVRHAIRQYNQMFGGNPVGTNPEITAALNGNNPKHIVFVDPTAGMNVNAAGELVDAWGTPYFFHQLSASDMEIHSAGPDKKMWTADDTVVR